MSNLIRLHLAVDFLQVDQFFDADMSVDVVAAARRSFGLTQFLHHQQFVAAIVNRLEALGDCSWENQASYLVLKTPLCFRNAGICIVC